MMARSPVLVTIGLGLVLTSCSGVTEPRPDLGPVPDRVFMTDATGYVAHRIPNSGALVRYRFTVITRYANRGTVSVFLGRCFPTSPQPLFSVVAADSSVRSGYEYVWACVGHDKQFELPPGALRTDTLQVEGPNMFDNGTNTGIGATSGRFKLYFAVGSAPGDGASNGAIPTRFSNEFIVRTAD